jgi:hypothetical protein
VNKFTNKIQTEKFKNARGEAVAEYAQIPLKSQEAKASGMGSKWQVASGKWQVASGKWQVASGKWQVGTGNKKLMALR